MGLLVINVEVVIQSTYTYTCTYTNLHITSYSKK